MATSAAAEVAGKAASLLKFGAGVYLFRDWLCEPTVVRKERCRERRRLMVVATPIRPKEDFVRQATKKTHQRKKLFLSSSS